MPVALGHEGAGIDEHVGPGVTSVEVGDHVVTSTLAVILGVPASGTEFALPFDQLFLDRSVLGCRYGSSCPPIDIPRYVELYRTGQLLLDELVTRTHAFEDFHTRWSTTLKQAS